ncbi:hypothetical protein ACHAXN_011679 [Cyclotella atomus]
MLLARPIFLLATATSTISAFQSNLRSTSRHFIVYAVGSSSDEINDGTDHCPQRRQLFSRSTIGAAGLFSSTLIPSSPCPCKCCLQSISSANALVDLTPPSSKAYDPARNQFMDSLFSWSMATTMDEYEEEAQPYKSQLFQSLFYSLPKNEVPVVVEVGMGTFPNAPYFAQSLKSSNIKGLDIIGVDPNDSMKQYALRNAQQVGLLQTGVSFRVEHGVAEALPFADRSVDAVIVTLTLCSVSNPERAVSEIQRVLKPNTGKFVFWEHVLAENDAGLALQQRILSPLQTFVADGCHLNRRTGAIIKNAGFHGGVGMKHIVIKSADIIGPTIYGIASA